MLAISADKEWKDELVAEAKAQGMSISAAVIFAVGVWIHKSRRQRTEEQKVQA
jgi:post-segregation antitoxin (ccd killing protein)